jgi:hypothetical protein
MLNYLFCVVHSLPNKRPWNSLRPPLHHQARSHQWLPSRARLWPPSPPSPSLPRAPHQVLLLLHCVHTSFLNLASPAASPAKATQPAPASVAEVVPAQASALPPPPPPLALDEDADLAGTEPLVRAPSLTAQFPKPKTVARRLPTRKVVTSLYSDDDLSNGWSEDEA